MAAQVPSAHPTPDQPQSRFVDDKSSHCVPFILAQLRDYQPQKPDEPFFIGLNGVQGAGKTTLVKALSNTLREQEHLETLVISIDDLYLKHSDLVELARTHPDNPLVQHRGEPGTHDLPLALAFFQALRDGIPTKIPQFDKSAYGGQGDRVPASQWEEVNGPSQRKVKVVIFEGWSVGFRPLPEKEVSQKQCSSKLDPSSTLAKHRLEDLLFVNEKLKAYDGLTNMLHAFIHIDAEETTYVYEWRLEQEVQLRREKGSGMTDEQVRAFVDGYYPAYELFTDELRKGVFKGPEGKGKQMRLIVGRDRRVKEAILI